MRIFSAKDLCSKSCMQIRMYTLHPELKQKTQTQMAHAIAGEEFQTRIAKRAKTLVGEELAGCYQYKDIRIYFSNDIICEKAVVEVKYIDPQRTVEEWFFRQSLLQAAFYYSLLLQANPKRLETAKFKINAGASMVVFNYTKDISYYLQFGSNLYQITRVNHEKIVDFFTKKAIATSSWDTAREFDNSFKHKEFSTLSNYFEYKKIK